MAYDFHTHTFFSDGELLPSELIRRAIVNGYEAMAITDHASASNMGHVIDEVRRDCELARDRWGFMVLPGVELTHCPASAISELAAKAKAAGAAIVVVHGETVVEPVEPGTNRAAVESPDVDVLAHPGFITTEEARIAAGAGIFLEISCRRGHSLTNGHVARVARETGALLLVNTDAHSPSDLLNDTFARTVALGAGLSDAEAEKALRQNPAALLQRVARCRATGV
ncbi:MAG: histidinol phosphate phosphatase domain-containing protein [Armatimonadota bacterium]|nr:histidinol phosphate phosphatase domain-containing protein [Armatimonadota bacterium]